MTDNAFDEMSSDASDGAPHQRIIGIAVGRGPALSSVELELREILDLASELALHQMGAAQFEVAFLEVEEGDDEPAMYANGTPSEVSVMEAAYHNAAMQPYRDRLALSRSMGASCDRASFKRACAEHSMTPGPDAAQLIARLAPYKRDQ